MKAVPQACGIKRSRYRRPTPCSEHRTGVVAKKEKVKCCTKRQLHGKWTASLGILHEMASWYPRSKSSALQTTDHTPQTTPTESTISDQMGGKSRSRRNTLANADASARANSWVCRSSLEQPAITAPHTRAAQPEATDDHTALSLVLTPFCLQPANVIALESVCCFGFRTLREHAIHLRDDLRSQNSSK